MFTAKENEAEARAHLRAFWAGSSLGRPALHVTAERPGAPTIPPRDKLPSSLAVDFSPAWATRDIAATLAATVYLAEAMPTFSYAPGNLITAVALLAGGSYHLEADSGWIEPLPAIWERPLPTFDPAGPVTRQLEACLRGMAAVVGGQGLVNPPVLLDAYTTLSGFRTPRQLCLDLLERPQLVRAWIDALTSISLAAYEHFWRLNATLGYHDATSWLSALAEGRFEAVQCDFAVMLSPRMFEEFVLPDLWRTTQYFDYTLYHLDGTEQMRFLDALRHLPRLNGIQWNPQPGAGPARDWIAAFREIRKRGFVLHVGVASVEEAVEITRALGPDGLLLILPRFATVREAEAAIARLATAV